MSYLINILSIIGALNWGLLGINKMNLVSALLGDGIATRLVYALVGLAGICQAYNLIKPFLPFKAPAPNL